jgi:hypothetical protein
MSTSQSIQGLIKWSKRGEWRDNFEAALERHVGPACSSAGIGLDELEEIIGDHGMSTLWDAPSRISFRPGVPSATSRTTI